MIFLTLLSSDQGCKCIVGIHYFLQHSHWGPTPSDYNLQLSNYISKPHHQTEACIVSLIQYSSQRISQINWINVNSKCSDSINTTYLACIYMRIYCIVLRLFESSLFCIAANWQFERSLGVQKRQLTSAPNVTILFLSKMIDEHSMHASL